LQGTVEERILGARRQLGVDGHAAAAASAAVADSSLMLDDGGGGGRQKPKKIARRGGSGAQEEAVVVVGEVRLENERRMQRVETLAAIFGCKLFACKA